MSKSTDGLLGKEGQMGGEDLNYGEDLSSGEDLNGGEDHSLLKSRILYQALLLMVPPHWGTLCRGELHAGDWGGGAHDIC